jgi:hypothetical protein
MLTISIMRSVSMTSPDVFGKEREDLPLTARSCSMADEDAGNRVSEEGNRIVMVHHFVARAVTGK